MEVIINASPSPAQNYHLDIASNDDACEKWGLEGATQTARISIELTMTFASQAFVNNL